MSAKKTIAICAIAFGTLFLGSCKKQQGEPGAAGAPGTNGTNGVANITTLTFTTSSGSWTQDVPNNLYYYNYNTSVITPQILSSGAVMVYLGDGTGTTWIAMPFTTQGVEFTYGISSGKVEIDVSLSNGSMPANPGGQQFKIVVIPNG